MKSISKDNWNIGSFVKLKNDSWLEKYRIAGRIAGETLSLLSREVEKGTMKSLLELDKLAGEYIKDNDCEVTFCGYHGFPSNCCISVNRQLVHSIATNYVLQEGDMVSFDLGATYQGAIGDTALTLIYGKPKSENHLRIIKDTEESMMKGIAAIEVGKRLGCIGEAIWKYAHNKGYGVITHYGGHGICATEDGVGIPHAEPFVSNRSTSNEGIRLENGMVLAIEPMLTSGSTKTWIDGDGWTVNCEADLSAHAEHSIFIHDDKVEILTERKN